MYGVYVGMDVQAVMHFYVCAYLGGDLTWRRKSPEDEACRGYGFPYKLLQRRRGPVTTLLFVPVAVMHSALVCLSMCADAHADTQLHTFWSVCSQHLSKS